MGLFDQPTPAQKIAARLINAAVSQAEQIARQYDGNYELLWNTPAVDPHDVMRALGDKAAELFVVTNQTMVLAGKGDRLRAIPERYTYSLNADGTITLTDVPEGVA